MYICIIPRVLRVLICLVGNSKSDVTFGVTRVLCASKII